MLNEQISKFKITNLPESIIENDIFSYLTSKDLYYSIRGVCTDWYEQTRNLWGGKIKDEMIDTVKSLDFIYEKELYTKTYEFKMKFLMNYRNLLSAYHANANFLLIAKSVLVLLHENGIKDLLLILFSFCELHVPYVSLLTGEVNEVDEYLRKEENFISFKLKMISFLEIQTLHKSQEFLNLFKDNFAMLNKEALENISENAKLIYSFLQGLIEYQILKLEVYELRQKIENLISRIQTETITWPKKKRFFEKAYKFLLFSKGTNENVKTMINLYEENKIRHTLVDYNDEAIKLIFDLKDRLNSGVINMEEIDEIIFENILSRRILLTKKIIIMEKFYKIYKEAKVKGKENEFVINNESMTLKQILWCMKFSSNSENENVNQESVLRTKSYLDKNFDYELHVIITNKDEDKEKKSCHDNNSYNDNKAKYRDYELEDEIEEASKEIDSITLTNTKTIKSPDELKLHAEEEIKTLKREKERLEDQKEKTEQILFMIKKFMALKEHMSNNKKKYKLILYILSKVRKGEMGNLLQEDINDMIQNIDIDAVDLDDQVITENEKNELLNFDNSEVMMKEIEDSIFKQIQVHLSENKNQEDHEDEDEFNN